MFGEDLVGQQLAEVRDLLAKAPGTPGEQAEPILTEAADGRIKITLGTDGRFERIKMTLSALKDGPDALVEQLKLGLNDALDQRAAATAVAAPELDMETVNEKVAELQDASLRQFQVMTASIREVMAKLDARR
ncbi:hypothetical protein [Glycomyces harbinensis]|uniref:YbaB/EbfC DNA-binding family protein n=1 Tax=Glycomyces harbinensis TaxID=58114 RepID=A0A1G7AS71_9ACTN|nr:hypothetical protein [Glycomyces harbinensis]SDE16835.1 hypothetical protein SAMN05216270_11478 [Glycomyces harbinensis]